MKTFKIAILSLIALPLLATSNASATDVSCHEIGAEPWHSRGIRLSDAKLRRPVGRVSRAYNGANIACGGASIESQLRFYKQLTCVGIWDYAFNGDGSSARNRVVSVNFTLVDDQLTATYEENWDNRKNQTAPKINMNCEITK